MLRTFNVKVLVLGYFPYFPANFRKFSNFKWGIPLQFASKSLSSKDFRTLFQYNLDM